MGVAKDRVFVDRLSVHPGDLLARALDWLAIEEVMRGAARVYVKPNLTLPVHRPGVTTTPQVIESVVRLLTDYTRPIAICESDGGLGSFTADQAFTGHELDQVARRYGVDLVNLSRLPHKAAEVRFGGRSAMIELPEVLLEPDTVLVDVPVFKTHVITGVTLCFKNLWGCIPTPYRLLYHNVIDAALAEIERRLNPRLCVVDGTFAMTGNGPMFGRVFPFGVIAVGTSAGATDLVCLELMRIDRSCVKHLEVARSRGRVPDRRKVETNVEPSQLAQLFEMERSFTDWGAFLASRSRVLTRLVYLSPFSGLKNVIVKGVRRLEPPQF